MASILLAWEFGGGSGHCVNLLPIAEALLARGHVVHAAVRDLHLAQRVFGSLEVHRFQAPMNRQASGNPVRTVRNFADILHNVGFGNLEKLRTLVAAWRDLLTLTKPSVLVAEHAPTALLASRFAKMRRAVIGTGFFSPPDMSPLPDLLSDTSAASDPVEGAVLEGMNQLLETGGAQPMDRLSQLYGDVDENFLLTFKELDHYPQRIDAEYWGMWSPAGGVAPSWNVTKQLRIFAYLQPPVYDWRPSAVLSVLRDRQIESLVYVPGIDERLLQPFRAPHIHFETRRLDMAKVCNECEIAITHGNNGTTTQLLRAGIPLLLVPIYLEQAIFSHRVVELGAGRIARPDQPDAIDSQLTTLIKDNNYMNAATTFARRYQDFDPQTSIDEIVARIEKLL